jgi:hypothetical protein
MNISQMASSLVRTASLAFFAAALLFTTNVGVAFAALDNPVVSPAVFSIPENSPNGTVVGTVVATDPELLTFAITDGDANGAFAINSATGEITVASSAELDYELTTSYSLTVTATDTEPLDGSNTITINVTNVNDVAPVADADAFSTDINTALNAPATGVLNGDSDVEGGVITATPATGSTTGGGTYTLLADGSFTYTPATDFSGFDTFTYTATDGVLTSAPATVTITVNKLAQTITFADPADTTYGDATSVVVAPTASSGLTVTVVASGACMNSGFTINFGDAGTCTITASQDGNAIYAAAPDVQQSFTIAKRPVTITAAVANKVYDATTASAGTPTLTAGTLGFSDTALYSQVYADEDVATGITLNPTSNLDTDNYDITYVSATGDITALALTPSATAADKVYDGLTSTTASVSVSGIGGDDVSATYTTADFDTKDVGTGKTVTVSGIALAGLDAPNYNLAATSATDQADVTKKALSAEVTVSNKVYDDSTAATITGYTPVGLVGAESVTINGGTATFDTEHVGNGKTVSVSGLNLVADSVSANYDFTDTDTTIADITTRGITVTAQTDTKVYDGDNLSAVTPVITGLGIAGTDTSGFSQEFNDENAGSKTLSVIGSVNDGNSGNNYAVTLVSAAGTITKAPVVITADDKTKVYGDANPTATASYTGFVSGEDESVIDTAPTLVITASDHTDVGDAAITVFGAADGNYSFSYVNGNLAVTKRPLTVTVDADDKVYDGTVTASVQPLTLNGVLFTDVVTVSSTGAAFDTEDVGTGKTVTATGIALSGADAGNYSIAATETDTADITPATVTVTANAATKIYGDADPVFTYSSTGLVAGDSFTGALGRTIDTGEDVGFYEIDLGDLDAGSNYDAIVYTSEFLTVDPAPLTITADDQTRVYGDSNPVFTLTYSGFQFSDDEGNLSNTYIGTTSATESSNAGMYSILVTTNTGGFVPTGLSDVNYDVTSVSGMLTITKADQSITFGPLSDMEFGDADFTVSATADSNVDGLTVAFSATGACTVTGDVVHLTTKGTCTITASQTGNGNWNAATPVAQSFDVADVSVPVITLLGSATVTIATGDSYTDAGATATDDVDGDITANIVTVNPVNADVAGTYTVTYNVTDDAGNIAAEVTRTVVVERRSSGGGSSRNTETVTTGGRVLGAALYFFATDLTIGSTGADVMELQKLLIEAGYLKIAAPTGYFGPMTQAAVKLYQTAKGIQATGYVGPLTRAALNQGTAPKTVEEQIVDLMAQLKALQAGQ